MATVFEYMYRDAGNYKSWGEIVLIGEISMVETDLLRGCLESEELFVAEQVGVPPLYDSLWLHSGGPTEDDHAYHEFVGVRVVPDIDIYDRNPWGKIEELLDRFREARGNWKCSLSPCCYF